MRTLQSLVLFAMVACGGSTPPPAPAAPTCALQLDQLDAQSFIMLKPMGAHKYAYWPRARMRFSGSGDDTTVRYSGDDLTKVFEYDCDRKEDGSLECMTAPFYGEICRALEVNKEDSCSADAIHALGFSGHEEHLDDEIKAAKEEVAKYRKTESWGSYALSHNNVGNGVQGILRIRLNERRCRLSVSDINRVVLHGSLQENLTAGVGEAEFTKNDDNLLFESCADELTLADIETPELPADKSGMERFKVHEVGTEVHYFYLGVESLKPEEGCTYTADLYGGYKPVQTDIPVSTNAEGKLVWHASHAWSADDRVVLAGGKNGAVAELVRYKTCADGVKTVIDAVCNYTIF